MPCAMDPPPSGSRRCASTSHPGSPSLQLDTASGVRQAPHEPKASAGQGEPAQPGQPSKATTEPPAAGAKAQARGNPAQIAHGSALHLHTKILQQEIRVPREGQRKAFSVPISSDSAAQSCCRQQDQHHSTPALPASFHLPLRNAATRIRLAAAQIPHAGRTSKASPILQVAVISPGHHRSISPRSERRAVGHPTEAWAPTRASSTTRYGRMP